MSPRFALLQRGLAEKLALLCSDSWLLTLLPPQGLILDPVQIAMFGTESEKKQFNGGRCLASRVDVLLVRFSWGTEVLIADARLRSNPGRT